MIQRQLQGTVQNSLRKYPIVGILGSRQVGKTTLARQILKKSKRKAVYLDLELPSDQNKLQDPELYLGGHADSLVVIDEIQRMPVLFPILRALVDQNRINGRFLILGSASPALIKHASESLAGRVVYHELPPLSLIETGFDHYRKLWLRGGDDASFQWREAFIRTYLEMDIPQLA